DDFGNVTRLSRVRAEVNLVNGEGLIVSDPGAFVDQVQRTAIHAPAVDAVVEHVDEIESDVAAADVEVPVRSGKQGGIEKTRPALKISRAAYAHSGVGQVVVVAQNRQGGVDHVDLARGRRFEAEAFDRDVAHVREARRKRAASVLRNE